jgi:hypothetical protein
MLQGIPTMTPSFRGFIQMVRLYMRDFGDLNRLVKGEETSDRMIAWSMMDALSLFNGTPPFLGTFSFDDLLAQNQQSLLLRMTTCTVIESVGLLQTRNQVNYSNGGINLGVNDKTPLLMKWLQLYKSFTDQQLLRVKVSLNIQGILGPSHPGISSELAAVNATYAGY